MVLRPFCGHITSIISRSSTNLRKLPSPFIYLVIITLVLSVLLTPTWHSILPSSIFFPTTTPLSSLHHHHSPPSPHHIMGIVTQPWFLPKRAHTRSNKGFHPPIFITFKQILQGTSHHPLVDPFCDRLPISLTLSLPNLTPSYNSNPKVAAPLSFILVTNHRPMVFHSDHLPTRYSCNFILLLIIPRQSSCSDWATSHARPKIFGLKFYSQETTTLAPTLHSATNRYFPKKFSPQSPPVLSMPTTTILLLLLKAEGLRRHPLFLVPPFHNTGSNVNALNPVNPAAEASSGSSL